MGLILQDCGAKLLLVGSDEQWQTLAPVEATLAGLQRILSLGPASALPGGLAPTSADDWLPEAARELRVETLDADSPATIVYTCWGAGELGSWGAGELGSWGAGELFAAGAGEFCYSYLLPLPPQGSQSGISCPGSVRA